jgi:hypothetical protein
MSTSYSPFPDCTLTVDGEQYSISRHVVASRSKLLKTIFESEPDDDGGYSATVQEAWNSCCRNLSLDLSFSVLMDTLHSGLADIDHLPPEVLRFFASEGVNYDIMLQVQSTGKLIKRRVRFHGPRPRRGGSFYSSLDIDK